MDVVRVGDPPDLPLGSTDEAVLRWCKWENRILITFDSSSMAEHLANHLHAGHHSPGVFMLRRGSRLPQIVSLLALIAYASEAWDWSDRIEFIP